MSRIRANQFTDKAGTGAPTFPNGVQVTGVATATSFSGALTGNATGLSGTPNITVGSIIASSATISGNVSVAGTLTYEDVTNVDSIGIVTARTGVRIDAGGLVVVGVTTVAAGSTAAPSITPTGDTNTGIFFPSADTIAFGEGGSEAARIDSSGRLLVGTSSSRIGVNLETEGSGGDAANSITRTSNDAGAPILYFAKIRSSSIVQSADTLGFLSFLGYDGSSFREGATITAVVDGTPGANDMPGRLVFATTADGASSPTERMRITSFGQLWVATTTGVDINSSTDTGFVVEANGTAVISRNSQIAISLNRQTDDGTIVSIRQAGTQEGSISVSGTTVSYNGAHLSRWSQLPNGAEREEILRGSVLSNLDEMCEWGEEDNEQLNRMKVSDVEGDKNVAGVFQCWDDDDDTYTNDFYCAMTGDFIIRIAEGVTVERGDLLMSAGDGTAKPQDDDIIRSKTIAKVTSTTVSCTYEDGSYCVPCVLMAC